MEILLESRNTTIGGNLAKIESGKCPSLFVNAQNHLQEHISLHKIFEITVSSQNWRGPQIHGLYSQAWQHILTIRHQIRVWTAVDQPKNAAFIIFEIHVQATRWV